MQGLDLLHRYNVIIVPSSSFQLVTDLDEARQTMANFFKHLESGGLLIMPFMFLWREGTPTETDWMQDGEKVQPEEGTVIRRWSRARYDPEKQLEHTETRFEKILEGDIIHSEYHSRSPATRWYTQNQARELYLQAGFKELQFFSEFSREPAQPGDRIFCVVGSKPAG
jgi:hypothetical protein